MNYISFTIHTLNLKKIKRYILINYINMYIFKYIAFTFHVSFILSTIFLWIWYIEIIFLQLLVILSWIFNKNQCLITQIEDYYFNQTLIEFLTNRNIIGSSRYIVPWYHRLNVYLIFIIPYFFNCTS